MWPMDEILFYVCTGAFLYVTYSFLLISNKFFVMGGGEGNAVMLLSRTSAVKLLNSTEGVVWALKLLISV